MKKVVPVLLVLLLLTGALSACQTKNPGPEPTEGPSAGDESTLPDAVPANIKIELFLNQYNYYNEYTEINEPDTQKIVITTDKTVIEFHFVEIDFDYFDGSDTVLATILHSAGELSPEKPFVVNWAQRGSIPHRGVVFLDEGAKANRLLIISESGEDGSLILVEEANHWLCSPRTKVTGILAEPGRAWESISVTYCPLSDEAVTLNLSAGDAKRAFEILSSAEATEVLTPFHMEGRHSSPMFTLDITFADGGVETIYTGETGRSFSRPTGTFGESGDEGYVCVYNEALYELLAAYFDITRD